jgi:hypothetical protein
MNKGGGMRIPTCAKMLIYRMLVPIDLDVVSCSRWLHQRTPLGYTCLVIACVGHFQNGMHSGYFFPVSKNIGGHMTGYQKYR